MSTDVISVDRHTGYQQIANLLIGHDVSAVPVVDSERRVTGVVSEADLMAKVEFAAMWPMAGHLVQRRRRGSAAARAKATGDCAGELMSAPPVTIDADASLAAAARTMADAGVKRLPVVDTTGRLIGIVSRRDLLRSHLRSDLDIRGDVVDTLREWFDLKPDQVNVGVVDGVVTLVGTVADRRQATLAVHFVAAIDGVVDVVDGLAIPAHGATLL
jgi:CBS domain-containing protein